MNAENLNSKQDVTDSHSQVEEKLNQVFANILPWASESRSDEWMLQEYTVNAPERVAEFLNSLYLFKISEISVEDDKAEGTIPRLLSKRHQALMTAAYQSDLTVVTALVGQGGGTISIYIGVIGEKNIREIFEHQLRGIYPGSGIDFLQNSSNSRLLEKELADKNHGGVITGIPAVRLENERQSFDLTSVIRSMYGEPFVLMTVAKPVPKRQAAGQVLEIMRIKDDCHRVAKQTAGISQNKEKHGDLSHAVGASEAKTTSNSVSAMAGGEIGGVGLGMSYTRTVGSTMTACKTITKSKGWSEGIGENLQIEMQNSLAMELEQIADKLINRLRLGLNSGIWETFITYATRSETGSSTLSGSICGELLKGDPEALPSRNVAAPLPGKGSMFLPQKIPARNLLTANPLVSFVSSEEAAILLSPPLMSVPGFDIRVKPALSLTDIRSDQNQKAIGTIAEHGRGIAGTSFGVSDNNILKHIFVAGITGSGKTNTVKELLNATEVPFLVLESAKREYRRLLVNNQYGKSIRVYTVGDSTLAPFRHNPFMVLPQVSALTHIDNLKSIFNASFSLYGPMPYILEQCIHNIYRKKGWNLTTGQHHRVSFTSMADCREHCYIFPTIRDLITEINRYVLDDLKYTGELRDNIRSAIVARMESLAVGAKGFIFNTHECADISDLLKRRVVFELESLADDDDKAFFVGLILSLISEYRQTPARQSSLKTNDGLQHILVIEEAHRLLKNIPTERSSEMMGNPRGKAVETFCNIIAEMRSLGQGVIVAEQIPTKIAPDVIKNTNTKIIHRLVSSDDQLAVGSSLGLPPDDCHYLNQLSTGFALAHKEGMARPIEVCIKNTLQNTPVGNELIKEKGREFCGRDLDRQLTLHDSGLLDDFFLPVVTLRLINTLFLSGKKLAEVLPAAIHEVQKQQERMYLQIATIEHALENWFSRILLSTPLDIGKAISATEKVLLDIERFWHKPNEVDTQRLIYTLDEWRGGSSVDRIREFAVSYVSRELSRTPDDVKLPELLQSLLLLNDEKAVDRIRETLRDRVIK